MTERGKKTNIFRHAKDFPETHAAVHQTRKGRENRAQPNKRAEHLPWLSIELLEAESV